VTGLLLIGQAPSRSSDPLEPLSGASGRRLAALMGLDLDAYLAGVRRANALPAFPGKAGKGDAFPAAQAGPLVRAVLAEQRVVLLGAPVASAGGLRGVPAFWWRSEGGRMVAWAPHPSGVSHWWNDPANLRRARRFWRAAARLSGLAP
jgi:uracil-DNA glycosylase